MGEKKKDKDFIVSIFYCRIKQHLNIYIDYVLQQWAGIINQSVKKLAPRRQHNIAKFFGPPDKSDEIKINLPEEALEFIKNMNKQQLVDFLLSNDD